LHHRIEEEASGMGGLLLAISGGSGTVRGWIDLVHNHPGQAVAVALGVSLFWGIVGAVAGPVVLLIFKPTVAQRIGAGAALFLFFIAVFAVFWLLALYS
jgi:hypothetical protein